MVYAFELLTGASPEPPFYTPQTGVDVVYIARAQHAKSYGQTLQTKGDA